MSLQMQRVHLFSGAGVCASVYAGEARARGLLACDVSAIHSTDFSQRRGAYMSDSALVAYSSVPLNL